MEDIKVLLTVKFNGGVLLSEEECAKKKLYNLEKLTVEYTTKDKKTKKEVAHTKTYMVATRKPRFITQSIKLNREFYKNAISTMPASFAQGKGAWNSMGKMRKLEAALQEYTEYLGGVSFEYEVLED